MNDAWLEDLPRETCVELLHLGSVGRLASIIDGYPIIVPVNYRLVGADGEPVVVIRTRVGGLIDQVSPHVAFEIDGVDLLRQEGWSVLVRGTVRHLDELDPRWQERVDPMPWIESRDAWLAIEPLVITGR